MLAQTATSPSYIPDIVGAVVVEEEEETEEEQVVEEEEEEEAEEAGVAREKGFPRPGQTMPPAPVPVAMAWDAWFRAAVDVPSIGTHIRE